ncbi:MAG: L-threonylcarbamoyladenylate synthase [Porphyromonadaceae bacterium]|nr:L-threonylcarbamoyladenylate synthase [Porphyromonadaceae bacterium]
MKPIKLYADSPSYRELSQIVEVLRDGGVIIYPTTSGYALASDALQARAVEKICSIKKIDPKKKSLSLMFASLSDLSEYCRLNDRAFKFVKEHAESFTFILPAAGSLPRLYKHRKEVGARLVAHPVGRLILEELGNPLIVSSLPLDEDDDPEYAADPELVVERFAHQVDLIVDGGIVSSEASTIVDCTEEPFEVVRYGSGRLDADEPLLGRQTR